MIFVIRNSKVRPMSTYTEMQFTQTQGNFLVPSVQRLSEQKDIFSFTKECTKTKMSGIPVNSVQKHSHTRPVHVTTSKKSIIMSKMSNAKNAT